MKIKMKKKGKVSKAELKQFLVYYDIHYGDLRLFNLFSRMSFILFSLILVLYSEFYSILLGVFLLLLWIVIKYIIINQKLRVLDRLDFEDTSKFIDYLEDSRRKGSQSIKPFFNKIRNAYVNDESFGKLDSFIFIILKIFIFLYTILLVLGILLKEITDILVIFILRIDIIIVLSIILFLINLYIELRKIDYITLNKCKDILESHITEKLTEIEEKIDAFIQLPLKQIDVDFKSITNSLYSWYDLFCSRFFESDELNLIYAEFEDLIFNLEDERFFLLKFSNLKSDIINRKNYLKQNNTNNSVIPVKLERLENVLNNYIEMLDLNIKYEVEIEKEKRFKLQTWQTKFYLILSPISLILSTVSIIFSFTI